jgi:hypothetical protein
VSGPGNAKRKMPHARRCEYRTAPPKGGRGMRAGNMGFISAETRAEQKRARELLIQSRELLKQMQIG